MQRYNDKDGKSQQKHRLGTVSKNLTGGWGDGRGGGGGGGGLNRFYVATTLAHSSGTKSIRSQVNSCSSQFVLILVNSYSFFGQFVLIEFFFGQFVLIWSIRTHFGQFVLILVNSFSH